MEKISETVWMYVKGRPSLREGLKYGIMNHSALARLIMHELAIPKESFNAVKAALIRISRKLGESEIEGEDKLLKVLRGSSLSIKTKVAAVVSSKQLELDAISRAKIGAYYIYLVEEGKTGGAKLGKKEGVVRTNRNLNLVTIKSSEEIEETPGVVAFIVGALAHEGINVVEFISCYTNTLVAIKEKDTPRAYELLSAITR
jgi:aspartokinase